MGAHGRQYLARDIRFRIRVTADVKDYVKFMQLHNHLSFLLMLSWQKEKIFRQNTVCFWIVWRVKSIILNTRNWLLVNQASRLSLKIRLWNHHLTKWHQKSNRKSSLKDINIHQFDEGELWLLNDVHGPEPLQIAYAVVSRKPGCWNWWSVKEVWVEIKICNTHWILNQIPI